MSYGYDCILLLVSYKIRKIKQYVNHGNYKALISIVDDAGALYIQLTMHLPITIASLQHLKG